MQVMVSSHYYQLMSAAKPRSGNMTTREGVTYRKTQAHLKPYQPQCKKSEDEQSDVQSSGMQTLKASCKQFESFENKKQSSTILF